jgi:hypothetical protein
MMDLLLPPPPPPPSRRVLFFTNSDAGQANAVLAVVQEMYYAQPLLEIHVAGDIGVAARVSHAFGSSHTRAHYHPVRTHTIPGFVSMWQAGSRSEVGMREAYDRVPGTINAARGMPRMPGIVQPWTGEEYAHAYGECRRILELVRPDYVVVEPLFSPAITLLAHMEAPNWCILSPNSIKDFAAVVQPRLAILWRYPM